MKALPLCHRAVVAFHTIMHNAAWVRPKAASRANDTVLVPIRTTASKSSDAGLHHALGATARRCVEAEEPEPETRHGERRTDHLCHDQVPVPSDTHDGETQIEARPRQPRDGQKRTHGAASRQRLSVPSP